MSTDVISRPSAGNSNSDDLSDAAASGEVDLRELIYQSLERDGLLSRLKAQLRAAVFTTIEKASSPSAAGASSSHSTFHPVSYEGANGRVARAIVLDWLACSHLSYSEDVLKVETSGPQHPPALSRQELLEQLPVKSTFHDGQPILYTLLNQLHHVPSDRVRDRCASKSANIFLHFRTRHRFKSCRTMFKNRSTDSSLVNERSTPIVFGNIFIPFSPRISIFPCSTPIWRRIPRHR